MPRILFEAYARARGGSRRGASKTSKQAASIGVNVFLRDYWYVAAWSADITRDPLARVILGKPICMYRTEDGKAAAVVDRCPHRNLPMSRG